MTMAIGIRTSFRRESGCDYEESALRNTAVLRFDGPLGGRFVEFTANDYSFKRTVLAKFHDSVGMIEVSLDLRPFRVICT